MASPDSALESEATELLRAVVESETDSGRSIVWPRASDHIPDDSPAFRIAWLGSDWKENGAGEAETKLEELLRFWGRTRREYRNGLVFATPSAEGMSRAHDEACRVIREHPEAVLHFLSKGEAEGGLLDSLKIAARGIYDSMELPYERSNFWSNVAFTKVRVERRDTVTLRDAARKALEPHLMRELSPEKLEECVGLGGTDCSGVFRALFPLADTGQWFFRFLNFPRLESVDPIADAIRRGVEAGRFGLLITEELLALDHLPEGDRSRVVFRAPVGRAEDFFGESGYLVWRGALEGKAGA